MFLLKRESIYIYTWYMSIHRVAQPPKRIGPRRIELGSGALLPTSNSVGGFHPPTRLVLPQSLSEVDLKHSKPTHSIGLEYMPTYIDPETLNMSHGKFGSLSWTWHVRDLPKCATHLTWEREKQRETHPSNHDTSTYTGLIRPTKRPLRTMHSDCDPRSGE